MEEKEVTEHNLKDYIVKLNDRNIQRRRETGFTFYAILGALGFCSFHLIDNLSVSFGLFANTSWLVIALYCSNLLFILSLFFFAFLISNKQERKAKIFGNKRTPSVEIGDIPVYIIYGSIATLNFYVLSKSDNSLINSYLWIFGILTILNAISPFIIGFGRSIRRYLKRRKGQSIERLQFTLFNSLQVKVASTSLLIQGFLLLAFLLFTAFQMPKIPNPEIVTSVVKFTVSYYLLLILLKIAMDIMTEKHDNKKMEEFEREIYVSNLTNEEIAYKFENEFDGIPFGKWLDTRHAEVMDFFNQKHEEFVKFQSDIVEVDKVDKANMSYEFEGRLGEIIQEQNRILAETDNFRQKLSSIFSNLTYFGSLSQDELGRLRYVNNFLNNNISWFNSQFKNLTNQIEDRQQ